MKFYKRALLSVTRRLGKTAILFIVVFILGNVIAGAISVRQATVNVEKNIKAQLGATASLEYDYENINFEDEDTKLPPIGPTVIDTVGKLPQIKYYDYSLYEQIQSKKIKMPEEFEENGMMFGAGEIPEFSLYGVQYPKVLDIEEEKIELIDGRVFSEEDMTNNKQVAIISMQLAEANGLSVGDTMEMLRTITTYEDNGNQTTVDEFEVLLEVVGIVDPKIKEIDPNDENGMDQFENYSKIQKIYTTNNVVREITDKYAEKMLTIEKDPEMMEHWENIEENRYYEPIFILTSPDLVEEFRETATAVLPQGIVVRANSDSYDDIAGSMKTFANLSNIILYVSVGATLFILSLLIILFLRDRRHEFGIYLSLGEAKWKVVGQVLTETLMIAFVAMSLSLVTGNMLARSVSDSMIRNQMESSQMDKGFSMSYMPGGDSISEEDIIDQYKVSLSVEYVLVFYAVGLLTITASTVIPTIYLLRLNPKKIMM